MDQKHCGLVAYLKMPYPPVAVLGRNPVYAKAMLDNVGGVCSEMSEVSLYLYNHVVTHQEQVVSQLFHDIRVTEMRHLEIFSQLAFGLGADPRLWIQAGSRKTYWSPRYNQYSVGPCSVLANSMAGEEAIIEKYRRQLDTIDDPLIQANLLRILADEEHHLELFAYLHGQYTV